MRATKTRPGFNIPRGSSESFNFRITAISDNLIGAKIEKAIAEEKIAALQAIYNSQKDKGWFTDDLFHSILRIRGVESNSRSGLAEAFYARKVALDPAA